MNNEKEIDLLKVEVHSIWSALMFVMFTAFVALSILMYNRSIVGFCVAFAGCAIFAFHAMREFLRAEKIRLSLKETHDVRT